jgi:formamidopyrimidine-DNA glycosylase
MPELPEVETVARALRATVEGARIEQVTYASRRVGSRCTSGWRRRIAGLAIKRISRRGKYLIFELSADGYLTLHLRMTGRLHLRDHGCKRESHDRLILELSGGVRRRPQKLVLIDTRQFARIEWFPSRHPDNLPPLSLLGPEATALTGPLLWDIVHDSRRPIKSLLLDQTRIAGLGNIYADESLFAARIHPLTPSRSLSQKRTDRLCQSIISILNAAITACGTTFDTFSDLTGRSGGFAAQLAVYQKTGLSCTRCGRRIRRITVGGRGTHFCPRCQKPPAIS